MSRVRTYDAEGRPVWSENQPGYRARVSGQRTGGMVYVGGELVSGSAGDYELKRNRERRKKRNWRNGGNT